MSWKDWNYTQKGTFTGFIISVIVLLMGMIPHSWGLIWILSLPFLIIAMMFMDLRMGVIVTLVGGTIGGMFVGCIIEKIKKFGNLDNSKMKTSVGQIISLIIVLITLILALMIFMITKKPVYPVRFIFAGILYLLIGILITSLIILIGFFVVWKNGKIKSKKQ